MPKPPPGTILSIKDVPVCNDRLYKEIAQIEGMEIHEVRKLLDFTGEYIAGIISAGAMEAVMLPGFGKFQPKKKALQTMLKVQRNQANGMDLLYRAVRGKAIIDKRTQNHQPDETI